MKFFDPNSKLYNILSYISTIFVVNILCLLGVITVVGFSLSMQLSKVYMEHQSITSMIEYIKKLSAPHILKSMLYSLVSIILMVLGSLNFNFLEGMLTFIYAFIFMLIYYMIVLGNLYTASLVDHQLKISHIIHTSIINYPKFVFFFSIVSGLAYILLLSKWFFIVIGLYLGTGVFFVFITSKRTLQNY